MVPSSMRSGMTVWTAPPSRPAALDRQHIAARPGDLGPHHGKALRQIANLGLSRRVDDHRGALGQHRREHQVLGRADGWLGQGNPRAAQATGRRRVDNPAIKRDHGPHGAQPGDMEIDAAQANCVAARHGQNVPPHSAPAARPAATRRPASVRPDPDRSPPGGCGRRIMVSDSPSPPLDQLRLAPRRCNRFDSTATSRLAGTLCSVTRCGVSSAETIKGSTAFFAPLTG